MCVMAQQCQYSNGEEYDNWSLQALPFDQPPPSYAQVMAAGSGYLPSYLTTASVSTSVAFASNEHENRSSAFSTTRPENNQLHQGTSLHQRDQFRNTISHMLGQDEDASCRILHQNT